MNNKHSFTKLSFVLLASIISLVCASSSASPNTAAINYRELEPSDWNNGFFKTLRTLTVAPDMPEEKFMTAYEIRKRNGVVTIVGCNSITGEIISTASIICEQKFIRECALKCYLEDVIVREEYQGRKLGLEIVKEAMKIAEKLGCYKISLTCDESKEGFYRKCGFDIVEASMSKKFEMAFVSEKSD